MTPTSIQWLIDSLKDIQLHNWSESLNEQFFTALNTDSRSISDNEVFIALKGPSFNGEDFVEQVREKGALVAVVSTPVNSVIPQIVVPDTKLAYGQLAKINAEQAKVKKIAITGSVGKTSVKEMCAAILSQKGKTLATHGNFNNEIGVPHTLMRLDDSYEYAVIELGANHIGEIAYTTDLTQPDVAVLNIIGQAHLEGFGGVSGVIKAKGEIFQGLGSEGVAILNGEQPYKSNWLPNLHNQLKAPLEQIVQFNKDKQDVEYQQVWCSDVKLDSLGKAQFVMHYKDQQVAVSLPMPGKHNVNNALSATAACLQLGLSLPEIASGVESMSQVKGRVNLIEINDSLLLIDDSYNANVKSVQAAIELLSSYQGQRILVFGDMGELGEEAELLHHQIGEFALKHQLSEVLCVGEVSALTAKAFGENGFHFKDKESLNKHLITKIVGSDDKFTVLVKGSRSAKMESVIEALSNRFSEQLAQDNKNNKG